MTVEQQQRSTGADDPDNREACSSLSKAGGVWNGINAGEYESGGDRRLYIVTHLIISTTDY